jgi:hypothetical protein
MVLSPDQSGREFEMKRTNVADEFGRVQRESLAAVEILGQLMAELDPKHTARRRSSRFARVVQRLPVITYSRNT